MIFVCTLHTPVFSAYFYNRLYIFTVETLLIVHNAVFLIKNAFVFFRFVKFDKANINSVSNTVNA